MEVDDKTTSSKLIMSAKKDQKFIWNRISTAFAPKKRYMHTMTEFGNALVVFVRFICLNQQGGSSATSDLWCYDTSTQQWITFDHIQGNVPCPRWGHSAVRYKTELLIFGGTQIDF